ncbi:hypothetical protein [Blautia wexlerae]|uniref:hypothetical protein n=1 Tax=Blautia wexlerae TaxID=418240 RepID=UPI0004227785|nr:hypothetical protein [Blautia wexlerae]
MSDYITVDEKLIDKLDEVKIDNGKCIMLYAKILAMASNKGYTTAGNAYFGRVLNLEDRQVRRHLNSLEAAGCITRFEKRRGSHTDARMIYPKLFIDEEDNVGQDCPDRTDETYDPGHKCPKPRSRMTKTPDGYDQNPGHTCPPVKECNRYVKDNSTADAETDASLVDVPLRCTEEVAGAPDVVASAPNSADAARLRLPDDLTEDIKNIKFEAKIDDKSMLEVMDRDYREHLDDGWETHEDIRDKLIEKFTTGFYCGNKDKVTAYAEFLMEHYKIVPIKKYL